ncbi:MAG: hypothetical protein WB626_09360 [Bacteroidota bacterium]
MREVLAGILLMSLAGCSDAGSPMPGDRIPIPDIAVADLLAVPETTQVDGRKLVLSTYLWRDFMPVSPPDGRPLAAILHVDATDSLRLPAGLDADALWIVWTDRVWKSYCAGPTQGDPARPYGLQRSASGGPRWGPHVSVDVIVRILDAGGGMHLLRASHQWIHRTD